MASPTDGYSITSIHDWSTPQLRVTDKIAVQNLSTQVNAGKDCWGREKQQPASISVVLYLRHRITTAATADELDHSTVHYGKFSKALLASLEGLEAWMSTHDLLMVVWKTVCNDQWSSAIYAADMEVEFPKASALCGRVSCVASMEQGDTNPRIAQTLYFKDLRIPTLIGVNSNEREKKQAVVISVSIDRITGSAMDGYGEVEKHVLEVSQILAAFPLQC